MLVTFILGAVAGFAAGYWIAKRLVLRQLGTAERNRRLSAIANRHHGG